MADFKKANVAPAGTGLNSRDPHNQGGAPSTGFDDAPQNAVETGNFGEGPGVPPNGSKIH